LKERNEINTKDHVVGFYAEKGSIINEAISSLAVKIHEYKSKYGKKSIVLTGCGVSNGATMTAINLAVALSQSNCKTLLIDADMRTQIKHKTGMEDMGLYDVISGLRNEADVIRMTNFPELHFMPSGNYAKIPPALLLCSAEAAAFIKRVSQNYDFVIIDCPAVTAVPETSVLFMSVDGILLICALDMTTKKQLQSAKSLIEPYAEKYYGLVVNSVGGKEYRRLFPDYDYYFGKYKRTNTKSQVKRGE
jgi:capsular exopolysaccharide synthesis family protein